jgi:hypothetical protein
MGGKTLAGARRLIDPVWGGMFQYSDKSGVRPGFPRSTKA